MRTHRPSQRHASASETASMEEAPFAVRTRAIRRQGYCARHRMSVRNRTAATPNVRDAIFVGSR
jgi:hypothetical protein